MSNTDNKTKYIKIKGLAKECNDIFNDAIKLMQADNCAELLGIHLFVAALDNKLASDLFNKAVSIENGLIKSEYENIIGQENTTSISSSSSKLNNEIYISSEVKYIIGETNRYFRETGLEVNPEMLLLFCLEEDNTSVFRLLNEIGLDKTEIYDELLEICKKYWEDNPVLMQGIPKNSFGGVIPLLEIIPIMGTMGGLFAGGMEQNVQSSDNNTIDDNELPLGLTDVLNIIDSDNYDNIIGRESEINDMIEVLSKRKGANPLLIGEPGVGKTAIAYGLAEKIFDGDVHKSLKGTMVFQLHIDKLTQGSRYRGELEEKFNTIIDFCVKKKAILIIDEFHTFMSMGIIPDGSVSPSNLIKPYLESGELKIIAITTLNEFKKYVERDQAICRRLKQIEVKEPSIEDTIEILKRSSEYYETFHKCWISHDLIKDLVTLCNRYITSRKFPDKAFTVLDEALAVTKLNNRDEVTIDDIKYVISKTSNVDINTLSESEIDILINLEDKFSERLIGQKHAISTVCKAIRRGKSGVCNPNKPVASFLFVGPTGVGKTELCKILSKNYGACTSDSLIRIDMSEYSEGHSVSKLFGSPPGYVGYEEGGGLTESVKHNPYSVILFDEIEKAHSNVFNALLQLLDEGTLTDGKGTKVDFKNCIIVMTSNAGYSLENNSKHIGFQHFENEKDSTDKELEAMKELEKTFRPEFLNRIDNVVIFDKITKEQSKEIVKLMFNELNTRLSEKNLSLSYSNKVLDLIVETGYSEKYNARNLRRAFQNIIENELSDLILSRKIKDNSIITLGVKGNSIKLKIA